MAIAATQISPSASLPQWQAWYGQNIGKTMMVGGQPVVIGQDIGADDLLSAFRSNTIGWGGGAQQPSGAIGGGQQPESAALQQMQQIDPTGEALRQGLGQSYLSQLAKTTNPQASDFQSYL